MRRPFPTALAAALSVGCSGDPDPGGGGGAGGVLDPGATFVAPELSDAASLALLADWRALPVLRSERFDRTTSFDRQVRPESGVAILANGNHDMNRFLCASRDAAAEANQIVPFDVEQPACAEPYVRGHVIARFEGSGRLSRIWMTAFSWLGGAGSATETMRIYVDDGPSPVVQVKLAAALDGSASEVFAPPFGAGSATHLAWYYPLVFSKKLVVAIDELTALNLYYHQTEVALDPEPIARVAAAAPLPEREAAAAVLGARDAGPVAAAGDLLPAARITLPPAEDVVVADLAGPATIHEVILTLAGDDVALLGAVRATVRWDGAAEAAVDAPLATLFAAALDPPSTASLALASEAAGGERVLRLRLPMPFASRADWTLRNEGATPIALRIAMRGEPTVPANVFGRLHAASSETMSGDGASRHPILDMTGPGRLVGVCFALEGHALDGPGGLALNFLEGDDRLQIDGRAPLLGTGTEDYLDSAFYFAEGDVGTAFAQAWGVEADEDADPPRGQVSACRWHVLGSAIDFADSLALDLEIGPDDPTLLDRYRSVAFSYR